MEILHGKRYRGEIIGRRYIANILELTNCYYLDTNLNNAIGSGQIIGTALATEINNNLITTLNTYVTTFNITNLAKPSDDDTKVDYVLKEWEIQNGKIAFKL